MNRSAEDGKEKGLEERVGEEETEAGVDWVREENGEGREGGVEKGERGGGRKEKRDTGGPREEKRKGWEREERT